MKNQNGITLIALVITIIVLLILAGVAIAMLSGDNGILKKASDAAKDTAVSNAKEQIALKVNQAITEYYEASYVNNDDNTQGYGVGYAAAKAVSEITATAYNDIKVNVEAISTDAALTQDYVFSIQYKGDNKYFQGKIDKTSGLLTWVADKQDVSSLS